MQTPGRSPGSCRSKGEILDTVCGLTGYHRDYAGRALRVALKPRPVRGRVARPRWFLSHVVPTVLLPTWIMLVIGLAAGGIDHSLDGSAPDAVALTGAAPATLPATWLTIGVTTLLLGLRNRWAALGWGVLAVAVLLAEFGPMMRLPQWLIDVSPYAHLSQLPGGTFATGSAVIMTGLALLAIAAGTTSFRLRDLG
jgi:ABC-2 type transport system permease protein